jgi:hypothetical protein
MLWMKNKIFIRSSRPEEVFALELMRMVQRREIKTPLLKSEPQNPHLVVIGFELRILSLSFSLLV